MGKGSRVRASRPVDRRGGPCRRRERHSGLVSYRLPRRAWRRPRWHATTSSAPVQEYDHARRAGARVADAHAHLRELAAARAEARRVVEGLEEVDILVVHLRVDGTSWAQVGRALGISRQGARQRFGDASGAHGIRQAPRDPPGFGR